MANEVRLIDMNVAMFNAHKEIYWTESQAAAVCNFLVHQPTVDPETLRPKGRWIEKYSFGCWHYDCSNCDAFFVLMQESAKDKCGTLTIRKPSRS